MTEINKKNITDKNKSAEFDTEIEYQDKRQPNARPSEPARATSSKPSAVNKEKVSQSGDVNKKV